ncbi:hypothetical protein OU789_12355 [Halocynthiibacter sp. C4]|uniref:hypothetical protein n=1 Tax=Halocynthiibacter sp. C4 TaxID=2992758 RepID=UPI00237AD8A2|nr:hypothetical protein [Halocynthiibacter sp. C4]MDE0590720.1 hypothetical protein [Halocynthiibacter sp. C4]
MTSIIFGATVAVSIALLLFAPFTKSALWRATVTPLASIIGSGFLVSAPLLAREFGGYAAPAMALLIAVAMLVGWTIRYNIRNVEPALGSDKDKALQSIESLSHIVLAFAYFISVAYYLSLLGHFILQSMNVQNELVANGIAIGLEALIGFLGWTGGAEKVSSIERYATALNLSVIAGLLVALAVYAVLLIGDGQSVRPPPGRLEASSLPVLLGLLIVVQGFETTRFMGGEFDFETRQKAMRIAQIVSGIIYIAFFILLSPLMSELAKGSGVAAIITVSGAVAVVLPLSLTAAAVASQFSASVADSLGDAGLIEQISGGKVDPRHGYVLISGVGIAILISLDVNAVIALASRAFALFYALQCMVAWEHARKQKEEKHKALAFMALSILCAMIVIFGVPAE